MKTVETNLALPVAIIRDRDGLHTPSLTTGNGDFTKMNTQDTDYMDYITSAAKTMGITPEALRERHATYHAAARLDTGVFSTQGGKLIYPDDTVRDGYQIVRAASQMPAIGSLVRYGTGGENHGMVGNVTQIGEPYPMQEDLVVTDEDYSYSGERKVGSNAVSVRRIYFTRA